MRTEEEPKEEGFVKCFLDNELHVLNNRNMLSFFKTKDVVVIVMIKTINKTREIGRNVIIKNKQIAYK